MKSIVFVGTFYGTYNQQVPQHGKTSLTTCGLFRWGIYIYIILLLLLLLLCLFILLLLLLLFLLYFSSFYIYTIFIFYHYYYDNDYDYCSYYFLPVVPHKAVAEVSEIGNR